MPIDEPVYQQKGKKGVPWAEEMKRERRSGPYRGMK